MVGHSSFPKGVTMPIAESDVKWVDEPRLGFWEQLYVPSIIDGLKTTMSASIPGAIRPLNLSSYVE